MLFNIGRLTPAYRQELKDQVDVEAETARSLFITSGSGQALEYEQGRQEAFAFKSAGYPTPIDASAYPFTKAQMDAYGQTAQVAADTIIAQSLTWTTAAATIKRLRLTAKNAVDAATSMADARAAVSGILWPTP